MKFRGLDPLTDEQLRQVQALHDDEVVTDDRAQAEQAVATDPAAEAALETLQDVDALLRSVWGDDADAASPGARLHATASDAVREIERALAALRRRMAERPADSPTLTNEDLARSGDRAFLHRIADIERGATPAAIAAERRSFAALGHALRSLKLALTGVDEPDAAMAKYATAADALRDALGSLPPSPSGARASRAPLTSVLEGDAAAEPELDVHALLLQQLGSLEAALLAMPSA